VADAVIMNGRARKRTKRRALLQLRDRLRAAAGAARGRAAHALRRRLAHVEALLADLDRKEGR
jgi:hypothetical protein